MQKRLLKISNDSIACAINALEALKTADIKSRKTATASAKYRWSKRIDDTTDAIDTLRTAKRVVRNLPKRVA